MNNPKNFNNMLKQKKSQRASLLRSVLSAFATVFFAGVAAAATTPLSDQPIRTTTSIPANVMLALSVEWPTGVVQAYNDEVNVDCPGRDALGDSICYKATKTYIGYFDPFKCYDNAGGTSGVFTPVGYTIGASAANPTAGDHSCSSKWSGNFLNWATMQTTDEFRWAMTGGDRYEDTATNTVLEKARHDGQGGYNQFPIKRIGGAALTANGVTLTPVSPSSVTPFTSSELFIRISALNTVMWISGNRSLIRDNNHPDSNNSNNNLNLPATVTYTEPGDCTGFVGPGTCVQVTSDLGLRTVVETAVVSEAGQCPSPTAGVCANAAAPTTGTREVVRTENGLCAAATGSTACTAASPGTRLANITESGDCATRGAAPSGSTYGTCSAVTRRVTRSESGTCGSAATGYFSCADTDPGTRIFTADQAGDCATLGAAPTGSTYGACSVVTRRVTRNETGDCSTAATGFVTCATTAAGTRTYQVDQPGTCAALGLPPTGVTYGTCSPRSGGTARRYTRTEAGQCLPGPNPPPAPTGSTYSNCSNTTNATRSVVRDEAGACPVSGAAVCANIARRFTITQAGQCPAPTAPGGTTYSGCSNPTAPTRSVVRDEAGGCPVTGATACVVLTRKYDITEPGQCPRAAVAGITVNSCANQAQPTRSATYLENGQCPATLPVGTTACTNKTPASLGSRNVTTTVTLVQEGQCASYTGGGTCTNTSAPSAIDTRRITNGSVPPATPKEKTITPLFVRVKVCDQANFPESQTRCTEYGSGASVNYKPEGIVQENALKMRFGAFGYLLDSTQLRDGGVLRARMKEVGPLKPVPGSLPVANSRYEWDETTGIYRADPDSTDSAATAFGATRSGVIQYLNKFGRKAGYKSFDPYSELYAEVLKYFKKKGATASYSSGLNADLVDGFPVITDWSNDDPIQYACQKNFIVGIADSNTHKDKNLSGGVASAENEPPAPAGIDTDYNVATLTNTVGSLETPAIANLAGVRNCCNGSAFLAGLAYYAHTTDLRPDLSNKDGKQTIESYFVDVREAGSWGTSGNPRNQLWLASKFGGFKYSNDENISDSAVVFKSTSLWQNPAAGQVQGYDVPNNYYAANQPDKLVNGLRNAFRDIGGKAGSAAGGSLASTDVSLLGGNNGFFKVQYDPRDWSGNVQALVFSSINADGTFTTDISKSWNANERINTQVGTNFASRNVITAVPGAASLGKEFIYSNLSATQKTALGGSAAEQQEIVDYLRGDRSKEILKADGTTPNPGGKYRTRKYLLGDIVDSEAVFVGAPEAEYDDALNPGYSTFKSSNASRQPLLYVGANDGMLHAIKACTTDSTAALPIPGCTSGSAAAGGTELFAFIPSAMYQGPDNTPTINGLRSLANSPLTHHFFVNAKPVIKDIDFNRAGTPGSGATTADWRTLLVGGFGKGGRGFYALDITDPSTLGTASAAAGKVLWEFTDEDMGFSYGLPVITKTRKWGWVVLLTSGYNNTKGTDATKRGKGFLYVVNPASGALLKKIALSTSVGSATDPAGFAQIAPYVPSVSSGLVDEVYGGDLLGNVWRIDFKDASVDPSATLFAELKDPVNSKPQPVSTAPVIDYSPNDKKRYVFVGTGRYLDSADSSNTQVQTFYVLRDGTQQARFESSATLLGLALPTGATLPLTRAQLANNSDLKTGLTAAQIQTTPMGWYFDLPGVTTTGGLRERISVQPKAEALGVIAWVGTLPETDACNPNGRSFTYKTSFGTGITQLYTTDVNGVVTLQTAVETSEIVKIQTVNINGETATLASSATGDPFKVGPSSYKVGAGRYLNWRELLQ